MNQVNQMEQVEHERGVPQHLLHTYLHMNGEFPMAPAAMDPAMGYAVLLAIARQGRPDPEETEPGWQKNGLRWLTFFDATWNTQQLAAIGHTVTQLHIDAGIPIVTAEQLLAVAAAHPTTRDKIAQASTILTRDFLDAEPPLLPPHCHIEVTAYGHLALVSVEAFQYGWRCIKERLFLALLNLLDALPDVQGRLRQPRQDAPTGSPLTKANALRLAQFASSPQFVAHQRAALTCYEAAYTAISAADDLAQAQHAAYHLLLGGSPTFRVTPALAELITRISAAVSAAAQTLPRLPTGNAVLPPEAISRLITDMTRKADEPTS